MARIRMKKGINVRRVVSKVAVTIVVLYAGGTVLSELGDVMNGTTSPFYEGLSLIGWTVSSTGQITATTGTGILSVVGIIAIASIVLEFVQVQL